MPIYAFRCNACGHSFDRLQKLSDADPRDCPECGAPAVIRQVTAPSFRLAGSGWYETDFKTGKDKQRNLAGRDDASGPAAGDKISQADGTAKDGGNKSSDVSGKEKVKASTPGPSVQDS